MKTKRKVSDIITFLFLLFLAVMFLAPIFIVLMNSFKGKFYISYAPFKFPTADTFVSFSNYVAGVEKTHFISAAGWSLFITEKTDPLC